MKEWMQNGEEMQNMEKMMQAWGDAWNEDLQMNLNKNPNEIQFQQENKFKDEPGDLVAIAKELIEMGKCQEAILCLEAEV